MPFAYLRDPLFLVACGAYFVNRLVLEPISDAAFWHCYLNDCICIPLLVPPMLWLMQRCGLRRTNAAPEPMEVAIPLVVWAVVFEVVLPQQPAFAGLAVADPLDVLCYCGGAAVAVCYWRVRYPPSWEREVAFSRQHPLGLRDD